MQYIIYTLIAAAIYFIGLGATVAYKVLRPKMRTIEILEAEYELYNKNIDWYNELEKDKFFIDSKSGYKINTVYIKNTKPTENTVILSHGVTMRIEAMIHYMHMFFDLGYNCIMYDHRAHGGTGGKNVSYGYYEKHDLAEVIKWAKNKNSGKLGLFGESMGAGISMQTLPLEPVDFLIEDCGYSSFDEQVKHLLRKNKLASLYPVYNIARLLIKAFGKYDIEKVSPKAALREVDVPVMIIHGDKDGYVPFYMADIIYDSIKSEKKMKYYTKDSRHAWSFYDYPEEYKERVIEFLNMCGMPCSK